MPQGLLSALHRSVHIIPQWRGDTEDDFTIAVVMDAVINPQNAEGVFRRSVNMNQVMNKQVARVSYKETSREAKGVVTQEGLEEQK